MDSLSMQRGLLLAEAVGWTSCIAYLDMYSASSREQHLECICLISLYEVGECRGEGKSQVLLVTGSRCLPCLAALLSAQTDTQPLRVKFLFWNNLRAKPCLESC